MNTACLPAPARRTARLLPALRWLPLVLGLAVAAPLRAAGEDQLPCHFREKIDKATRQAAEKALQKNKQDLDALICVGLGQNHAYEFKGALQTFKQAERLSQQQEERELDLIQRYINIALALSGLQGNSQPDDRNYYATVLERAVARSAASIERCFAELGQQHFDAAIQAAQPLWWRDSHSAEANLCLAKAYQGKGDWRAVLRHAHRLEKMPSGQNNGLVLAQGLLSTAYQELGDLERALAYGNQALVEWRRLGNKGNEATLLNNIAVIYKAKGERQRAIIYYEQSLALEDKEADKAATWNNLATIYLADGDTAKAIDFFNKALAAERRAGNRLRAATKQLNLGNAYRAAKDEAQAETALQDGLRTVRQLGAKDWEATAYLYLGHLRFDQGRLEEAKQFTRQAIDLSRQNGQVDQTAVANLEFLNKQ